MTNIDSIIRSIDVGGLGLTKNNFSDYSKTTVDSLNSTNVLDKHFLDDAFCVSDYAREVYSHQGYVNVVGEYIYTLYMCNDGTYDNNGVLTIGSGEGETGQLIRMSRVHVLNHTDRTFYDIGKQLETYDLITNGVITGTVTLQNFRLQGHQAFLLSDGYTIRCFMTALIYGESQYFFRDFNTKTNTLGAATLVRLYPKTQSAWVLFNRTSVYDHFDWWMAGMPSGSYPVNALGGGVLDFMLGTIKKMFNNSWYCVVNVGSGSDNRAGGILMRSVDQGVNWYAETAFNPLTLPGTTGTDRKFLWEGVVTEDSNNYYAILRGAGDGLAAGLWKATIAKTSNLKSYTISKLLNESNEKVCIFNAYSRYYMINPQFNKFFGPLNSNRTVEGVYQFDATFSTATRLFGFSDANGCHTWDVNNLKETPYGVYSSSKERKYQNRSGQAYYANTSEIWCKRIKGDYLVQ